MSFELLDWLKTPMAAPESATLRSLRFTILGTCAALLGLTLLFAPLHALIGPAVAGVAGGLLVVLAVLVPVYIRLKNRADDAWIDEVLADSGGEGE